MTFTVIGQARFHFTYNTFLNKKMYCINTNVQILFLYVLLTLLDKYQTFIYKTLISMVDCHGEKSTKHFDQCGSHDDKNTLYFGGLGQITDTITKF